MSLGLAFRSAKTEDRHRTDTGSALMRSRRRLLAPLLLPALTVYCLVMIVPLLVTVWISFNSWAGAGPMKFVGLDNYRHMIGDPVFLQSFKNTFTILFVGGAAVFIISFALTTLLHDAMGKKFVRTVIFFPALVPGIVIAILWGFLFNADGLVNSILRSVGVENPPLWLARENTFFTLLAGIVWLTVGTYTVILMAAAGRIPPSIYEAAELDGASAFRRFRSITLPLTRDVASVLAVLWSIGALKTFEFILVFAGAAGQMPPSDLWTFALYSYASAFGGADVANFGIGSSSAVLSLALTVVLVILVRRITSGGENVDY